MRSVLHFDPAAFPELFGIPEKSSFFLLFFFSFFVTGFCWGLVSELSSSMRFLLLSSMKFPYIDVIDFGVRSFVMSDRLWCLPLGVWDLLLILSLVFSASSFSFLSSSILLAFSSFFGSSFFPCYLFLLFSQDLLCSLHLLFSPHFLWWVWEFSRLYSRMVTHGTSVSFF